VTRPERLEDDTTDAVRRLMRELTAAGREPRDPVGCLMHETDDGFELRITVTVALAEGDVPGGSDIRIQRLPGGRFAKTLHRGPYEALGLAHAAVFAWVRERGHAISGPVREIYTDDPAEVDAACLRTDVLLPFDSS
jgi:effector-binding domain-containing protein